MLHTGRMPVLRRSVPLAIAESYHKIYVRCGISISAKESVPMKLRVNQFGIAMLLGGIILLAVGMVILIIHLLFILAVPMIIVGLLALIAGWIISKLARR